MSDPRTLPQQAREFVEADPVANNVICLTIANVSNGSIIYPDPLFACVMQDEAIVNVAMHTPPFPLVLSVGSEAGLEALAVELARTKRSMRGVSGPPELSAAFASWWSELSGSKFRPGLQHGIFRLVEVELPPQKAGELRPMVHSDYALLRGWMEEILVLARDRAPDVDELVARVLRSGDAYFWSVGGIPVSMALISREIRGVVQIAAGYTPQELRGHGYNRACVAEVSRLALGRGAVACVGIIDKDNPIPNRIYREIGFRPYADIVEYDFDA